MEDKKVYCRRASELKSIDELGLPEEAATYLKRLGRTTGEILAAFRCGTPEEWFDDTFLHQGVDEAIYDDYDDFDHIAEMIYDKFEEMGFLRNDLVVPNFILVRLLKGLWIENIWRDEFLDDNNYVAFNEKYEEYAFPSDRAFEMLHDGLTEGQYKIIKYEIDHASWSIRFSNEEESLREVARMNIRRLLKEEIMEVILS